MHLMMIIQTEGEDASEGTRLIYPKTDYINYLQNCVSHKSVGFFSCLLRIDSFNKSVKY